MLKVLSKDAYLVKGKSDAIPSPRPSVSVRVVKTHRFWGQSGALID